MAKFAFRYGITRPLLSLVGAGSERTYMEVEGGRFRVRFGPSFSMDAPLDSISSAERIEGSILHKVMRGVGVHGLDGHWAVNAAAEPIVRLHFREPQRARILGLPSKIKTLDVSPDDPTLFLAGIGHPS
ncbi:MAG TPA: hypothetical protein VJ818_03090 [Actinomycetota bacterium]|nr:hypothetical protein [Actinomycetota bacterium]